MAPRAYWKGYLRLSLVSCPVVLYVAASASERVRFHRINRKTGNRLRQQMIDPETGEAVPKEDVVRGYEVGKGQYIEVEDEGAGKTPDREHAHDRHRQLRAEIRDRRPLSRQPVLSRAHRQGGAGA